LKNLPIIALVCGIGFGGQNQLVQVSGTVSVARKTKSKAAAANSAAVIWLKPVGTKAAVQPKHFEIRQEHKRFDPRVLVLPVGSAVAFPNFDPFLHNVFSMFDGKRFDLGLYESGASHRVTFDRAGMCYIFCNIHPEMSAIVIVIDTPYYATAGASGEFTIAGVPCGRYQLHVWHERAQPEMAGEFPREIRIAAPAAAIAPIRLVDSGQLIVPHKNKYGKDYDAPAGGIYK
jgi:plastocyanin